MIICLLMYILLIETIPWYTYIIYSIVLSGHAILMLIFIYSATIVWSESNQTYKLLLETDKLTLLSTSAKLKVCQDECSMCSEEVFNVFSSTRC